MNEPMQVMSEKLQSFVERGILSGAVVAMANRNKILHFEAVGYSNLALRKVAKKDDIYWIASMTKPMTGAALMMLVEEGKVNVNDPVEKYLPEFKGQKVKEEDGTLRDPSCQITLRQALTHTAGLSFRSTLESTLDGKLDRLPLKQAVESYAADPLRWDPDTKYDYANQGTNTVGRIIEVVSGMPYEKFMEERLFIPLGMKDTTFWPKGEQLTRVTSVYRTDSSTKNLEETKVNQITYPLDDVKKRFPFPAGGLFSTAEDVCKFSQMILNDGVFEGKRYLLKSSIDEMTSKQTAPTIEKQYGYGWEIDDSGFGHSGAYKTQLRIFPREGIVLAFMVQQVNDWIECGEDILTMVYQTAKALGSDK